MGMNRRRRTNTGPIPLKEALADATKTIGINAPDAQQRLLHAWNECVQEPMRSNLRPARVQAGVLTLHAQSGAWASQADYFTETLLESLRAAGIDLTEIRVIQVPE